MTVATPAKGVPPIARAVGHAGPHGAGRQADGVKDKQTFKTGPRELKGSFGADPSGIKTVKLRLAKRSGGKCWYFSGKMETFRRTKCGTEKYFAIGDRADWSYLLPAGSGRAATCWTRSRSTAPGNRTPLVRGTTQVVFTVR